MPDDGPPLTADDVEAAASVGRLPGLARQLVMDGAWTSMEVVLRFARDSRLPLGELEETVRVMSESMTGLAEARRAAAREEIRALEKQAAVALQRRLDRDPLTTDERRALTLAARLLAGLGDMEKAALAFERAGEDARAAEAYGALGDLDRMEACLAREEQRRRQRHAVADLLRRFETLLAAGERAAALEAAASLPRDDFETSAALTRAQDVDRRLCRGHAVTLRAGGEAMTFAGTPAGAGATLGRDGLCEVALRDPGVSRRHARLLDEGGTLVLLDAGSRAGTRVGGAVLRGRLPLVGEGEIGLGEHCTIHFQLLAPGLVALRGRSGLDRGLRAYVHGAGALPLGAAVPEARGLALRLDGPVCRLVRAAEIPARVDGRLIGAGCDLLHGDVIDGPPGLRLEVL